MGKSFLRYALYHGSFAFLSSSNSIHTSPDISCHFKHSNFTSQAKREHFIFWLRAYRIATMEMRSIVWQLLTDRNSA
jgi:hypothetical protein